MIFFCNESNLIKKDSFRNAILTIKIIISANIDTTKASSEKIIQTLIITNAVTEIRS